MTPEYSPAKTLRLAKPVSAALVVARRRWSADEKAELLACFARSGKLRPVECDPAGGSRQASTLLCAEPLRRGRPGARLRSRYRSAFGLGSGRSRSQRRGRMAPRCAKPQARLEGSGRPSARRAGTAALHSRVVALRLAASTDGAATFQLLPASPAPRRPFRPLRAPGTPARPTSYASYSPFRYYVAALRVRAVARLAPNLSLGANFSPTDQARHSPPYHSLTDVSGHRGRVA
jgi:hypothetical protein